MSAVLMMSSIKAASGPAYDPATAVTLSGTVTAVRIVAAGQPLQGVHLLLKTKTGAVEVYLAPKNFVDFLKINYVPGDPIEVIGSRVKTGSAEIVLARQVEDGRDVIELRDLYGSPVWEHWGVEADPASVR